MEKVVDLKTVDNKELLQLIQTFNRKMMYGNSAKTQKQYTNAISRIEKEILIRMGSK